jgi:hypothetical protein
MDEMLASDEDMQHDAAWHARISLVLSGALGLWGVRGTVAHDPDDMGGFIVAPAAGRALRVRRRLAGGWTLAPLGAAPGPAPPAEHYAGLPGLLRRLREELAPEAPAGRLVIGAQPLLHRTQEESRE